MEAPNHPLNALRNLLGRPGPGENSATEQQPRTQLELSALPQALRDDVTFLRPLCTRLWRVEREMKKLDDQPGMARLQRRFQEVMETLSDAGIEIVDHTAEKYDPGLTLRVLQYEPRDDLEIETIVETVQPSLRLRGLLVPGEVIVGVPPKADAVT